MLDARTRARGAVVRRAGDAGCSCTSTCRSWRRSRCRARACSVRAGGRAIADRGRRAAARAAAAAPRRCAGAAAAPRAGRRSRRARARTPPAPRRRRSSPQPDAAAATPPAPRTDRPPARAAKPGEQTDEKKDDAASRFSLARGRLMSAPVARRYFARGSEQLRAGDLDAAAQSFAAAVELAPVLRRGARRRRADAGAHRSAARGAARCATACAASRARAQRRLLLVALGDVLTAGGDFPGADEAYAAGVAAPRPPSAGVAPGAPAGEDRPLRRGAGDAGRGYVDSWIRAG